MTKRMLIDALHADETRVVIADDSQLIDFDFVTAAKKQIKGNIYLAKITRVEPSLQAAFVEYGGGKQGFLPFGEIHPDYYQIPASDRQRMMEEAMAQAENEQEEDEADTRDEAQENHHDAHGFHHEDANQDAALPEDANAFATDTQPDEYLPETEAPLPTFLEQAMEELPETEFAGLPQPDIFSQPAGKTEKEADIAPVPAAPQEGLFQPSTPLGPQANLALESNDFAAYMERFEPKPAPQAPLTDQPSSGFLTEPSPAAKDQPGQPQPDMPQPDSFHDHGNGDHGDGNSPAANDDVETVSGDEERRPKRPNFTRRYKIQEVIKRGQVVLVQVIKEERGNKGVSLSTYISLAGRYCVLMPNSPKDGGGISRKIQSSEDRKRLRQISAELRVSAGMSAIIRTAGMDRSQNEIKRDFDYLVKLWNTIREKTLASTAPATIHEEGDIIKRSIRDLYNNDIQEVVVEGEQAFHTAKDFMAMMLASHAPRVKLHKSATPLFYEYNVEDQLLAMHDPVVRLKSGGYIVINPTEALISIDVNSGRATGERNIEETASKTNLEAAYEIARQVKLRDLAGLLVIDFIDMIDSRNRRSVERALKDALKADRAKIQLSRISAFGLLEMSRQRLRPSISEASTVTCAHCSGKGVVRSPSSVGFQVIRALEKEAAGYHGQSEFRVILAPQTAMYLFNQRRDEIRAIEQQFSITISFEVAIHNAPTEYKIERVKPQGGGERYERGQHAGEARRGRGRDRNRGRSDVAAQPGDAPANHELAELHVVEQTEGPEAGGDHAPAGTGQGEPRSRRGRRGGGRSRSRRDGQNRDMADATAAASPPGSHDAANMNSFDGAAGTNTEGERSSQREKRDRNRRGGRGRRRWKDDRAPGGDAAFTQASGSDAAQDANPHVQRTHGYGDASLAQAAATGGNASHGGHGTMRTASDPVTAPPTFSHAPSYPPLPSTAPANRGSDLQAEAAPKAAAAGETPAKRGWWRRMVE